MFLLLLFLKIFIYFITKSDIQRGGETERKIFHLMIHSPSGCKGWCCADPKPGPTWVKGPKALGHLDFPPRPQAGRWMGSGWEVELLGLEPVPIWDPGVFKVRTLATRPCGRAPIFSN